MKRFYLILSIFIFFLVGFLVLSPLSIEAGIEHNVWGWAWSKNIGWVSFNSVNCDYDGDGLYEGVDESGPSSLIASYCPLVGTSCPRGAVSCPSFCDFDGDEIYEGVGEGAKAGCPVSGTSYTYGVNINSVSGDFSGYAWSDNIGWIRFDPEGPYPNCGFGCPDYSVKLDTGTNEISGWARACFVFQIGCDGALKPNSERGDSEGWLKFDEDAYCLSHLENSSQGDFYEFYGWAWGAHDLIFSPVPIGWIGWLSFNNRNCDLDNDGITDDGITGYCPWGEPSSVIYKVYTSLVAVNQKPYVELLRIDGAPTYCGIGPGRGQVRFLWTYQDADGDDQAQYNIQVDDNDDFSSPMVDYTASQTVIPGSQGTSAVIVVTGIPELGELQVGYRTQYYWRISVKASTGNTDWSDWVEYDELADPDGDGDSQTFTTPGQAYPYPDFNFIPKNPIIKEGVASVDFIDASKCYDAVDNEYNCQDLGDNVGYEWDFDYDYPFGSGFDPTDMTKGDTAHDYLEEGDFIVRLRVADDYPAPLDRACIKNKPLTARLPAPGWKETTPF